MRRIVWLCICILLLATFVSQVHAEDLQVSQGFTYWNATSSWFTVEGEAPWFGLQISLVTPDVWWVECLLGTGEEDYINAVDVIYSREAQLLAGLYSSKLGLGVGVIWISEDFRGYLPPYNTLGALATARMQFPIVSDSLTAHAAITVQPMVFGADPWPREFIEYYAGIDLDISWLRVDVGYRHRSYYNFNVDWRVSGLVASFLLRL